MRVKIPGTIPYFLQECIRELIIDGSFLPGQPLREQDLEKRFGTSSRGPIREALRLLEQSGLVSHAQRKGFWVTLYTKKEIVDQYQLRAELEAYAIMCLAENNDLSPLLEELAACHMALAKAYDAGDPRAYLSEIRNFYTAIAQYTQNVALCEALTKLNEKAEPIRYNLISRKLDESKSLEYTRQIMHALEAREFERAASLKREHVLLNLPSILDAYQEAEYKDKETDMAS